MHESSLPLIRTHIVRHEGYSFTSFHNCGFLSSRLSIRGFYLFIHYFFVCTLSTIITHYLRSTASLRLTIFFSWFSHYGVRGKYLNTIIPAPFPLNWNGVLSSPHIYALCVSYRRRLLARFLSSAKNALTNASVTFCLSSHVGSSPFCHFTR